MAESDFAIKMLQHWSERVIHTGIYCKNCGGEYLRFKHPPATDYDPQIHGELDGDGQQLSSLICMTCGRAAIRQKAQNEATERYLKVTKYGKYRIFKARSMVGRKSLWYATFDTFKAATPKESEVLAEAKRIAGEFAGGKKFNAIFTGDAGRGKSHLAMAILQQVNEQLKEQKFSCLFININELIRVIQTSWKYPDQNHVEENIVNLMRSVDLLVIDDLGTEAGLKENSEAGNWVQGVIYNIFNARECNTIITTNLKGGAMKTAYNDKIVSRIMENASNSVVKFDGISDKRRK